MYNNCFALVEDRCGVLKEMLCKKGKCPFYKSKELYKAELLIYPNQNDKRKIKENFNYGK